MLSLVAYLFYFFASTLSPLQRRWLSINREGELRGQINFASRVILIMCVLGTFTLPWVKPFEFNGEVLHLVGLALICGLFGAGFWVASYTAQRHVDAGITTLVGKVYMPVTIVLSTLLLDEKLVGTQAIGAVVLFFSILLISKKHRIGRFSFDKYFVMMLASSVMLGVLLVAERALQKVTGFTTGTLLSWWSQAVAIGVVSLFSKEKSGHTAVDTAITGVVRFLAAFSWVFLLYTVGNLSLVSTISTFGVVIVFITAALFLGEREDLGRKLLGSVLAVIGLLLMK